MTRPWKTLKVITAAALLVGCTPSPTDAPPPQTPGGHSPTSQSSERQGQHSTDNTEETEAEQLAEVRYYISKLPDRTFVDTYGGEEHPRTWYTAAEALGAMGTIAIPALIDRLDTSESNKRKPPLYALMHASHDPKLIAKTESHYLQLTPVLTQDTNAENLRRARAWVQRYQHLFR